jgi:Na+-translocating ferredoxin:NAD+ oxidoreductase RnfD subunit
MTFGLLARLGGDEMFVPMWAIVLAVVVGVVFVGWPMLRGILWLRAVAYGADALEQMRREEALMASSRTGSESPRPPPG